MIEVWNKIDLVDKSTEPDGFEDENFLTEDKEEEDLFSEDDDGASEQSSFDSLDDGVDSECLSEENSEECHDAMSSNSAEPIETKAVNTELSSKECSGEYILGPEAGAINGCSLTQPVSTCHVKTSAVMGLGLQELLTLIDKKLTEQQTIVHRSYGPFDRKWRPSYSTHDEKVAEQ